jgi:sialic acid synthase SpsE
MLGQRVVRPTPAEREVRAATRRSVAAVRHIAPGEAFTTDNVGLRRPGTGLPPEFLDAVLRCVATRDIERGEVIGIGDARLRTSEP